MTIAVAYGKNLVIGKDGKLAGWRLPTDMEHFKELTLDKNPKSGEYNGSIVVMGRKTFESFPKKFRPLPGRHNYIFSRQIPRYNPEPSHFYTRVVDSFFQVFELWDFDGMTSNLKIFVIGGAEIYTMALALKKEDILYVNEIIATEIDGDFEGDTFFPAPDYSQWNKEVTREVNKDEKNSHNFKIVRYWR